MENHEPGVEKRRPLETWVLAVGGIGILVVVLVAEYLLS